MSADDAPVHWPQLTAEEAAEEWPALREWVGQLADRFPRAIRLPACWWRHNDLVESLAALRDHERGCFAPTAPATAAVDWQRALRDTEARLDVWIKRLTCTVPGREHPDAGPHDWDAVIAADLAARQTSDEQHPPA